MWGSYDVGGVLPPLQLGYGKEWKTFKMQYLAKHMCHSLTLTAGGVHMSRPSMLQELERIPHLRGVPRVSHCRILRYVRSALRPCLDPPSMGVNGHDAQFTTWMSWATHAVQVCSTSACLQAYDMVLPPSELTLW